MILNKVLIDTNICLDAIQRRKPYVVNAAKIFEKSENKKFKGFVSAHSFDTLFYILSKKWSSKRVYKAIGGLRRTIDVARVDKKVIDEAFRLQWSDFEDAIHYQAALAEDCDAIVSRDKNDFENADLQVLSPIEFLDKLSPEK